MGNRSAEFMEKLEMTFNDWWAQFCEEWERLGIDAQYRPPQAEFFDYFEDGDDPREAALDEISHIGEFQEDRPQKEERLAKVYRIH